MPLYEYQCKTCHQRFEKIQRFSDPPETHCPKCNGEVEKLFSAPAVQFKGSGFYATDYPKKSSGGSSGDSGSSESSAKSGDAGSSSSDKSPAPPATPSPGSSSDKK